MSEPLIKTEHLSVVYSKGKPNEVRSLWDANITIYPEEFVIIHGPSGCGKSTLMYSIASLQPPTSGDILLRGKSLATFTKKEKLEFRRTGMGMIFQAFYLIETLRVVDNVSLPKLFRNESKSKRHEESMVLLKRFGIDAQSNRYPSQLSGGQKQRTAIARALINNPDIIFADEPVGNLDSESSRIVLEILRELNERDKKTIVLVTHDPAHLAFGDRIIHMKDGQVIREEVRKDKRGFLASQSAKPEKETVVNPDLSILLRSFQNLPKEYIQTILTPFKAKQLMFHFMSNISETQWMIGERLMRERLDNMIGSDSLFKLLDAPLSQGGAGLNRTRAASLVENFETTFAFITSLKNELNPDSVNMKMFQYLQEKFALAMDDESKKLFLEGLKQRSAFNVGKRELLTLLDAPKSHGGIGLHHSTAEKVAQEIEMIFLLKY